MKARCVSRELTIEMIVGVFMASVFVVLVLFTIVISGGRFGGGYQSLEVNFHEVMGLRRHDNVLVRGMPVGAVQSLELDADRVRVIATLHEPVVLNEGYRIRVLSASMLGGNHLVIDVGDGEPLQKGVELWGETPVDLMDDFAELVTGVRNSLIAGGTLENLRSVSEDVAKITARVQSGEGTIGRLLSDDDTLYADLERTVASLSEVSGRLERGEGLIGRLLGEDDGFYDDLRGSVASLRDVTGRFERGEGTLGRLFGEDETMIDDLAAGIANMRLITDRLEAGEGTLGRLLAADDALYQDIAATGASLRRISERLDAGEGTLGRLLSADDELYRQLYALLENARETLDDYREASPVLTFSSILFGAF